MEPEISNTAERNRRTNQNVAQGAEETGGNAGQRHFTLSRRRVPCFWSRLTGWLPPLSLPASLPDPAPDPIPVQTGSHPHRILFRHSSFSVLSPPPHIVEIHRKLERSPPTTKSRRCINVLFPPPNLSCMSLVFSLSPSPIVPAVQTFR